MAIIAHLGIGGTQPEATRAALLRDQLAVLAGGVVVLCSLDLDDYVRLAEALGYRPIPGSELDYRGRHWRGYALDLRRVGPELWLQTLLSGGPSPPVGPGELERELHAALTGWSDDRALAPSALGPLAGGGPDEIRALVERALGLARERAATTQETALRAVELAYLERATSHERAAEELYVSRATFYRLLHRGVALIADALPEAARSG